MLALLLLSANRVVARGRLIDELWGDQPPETAVATLPVYVSPLRKLLPEGVLLSRPPGYVLSIEPGEFDLLRFDPLLQCGKAQVLEPPGFQPRKRLARKLGQRRSPPELECVAQELRGVLQVRFPRFRDERLERLHFFDLTTGLAIR